MELERKKRFIFKGEEYEIEVPTIGQYLEIEDQKIINSNGHWFELIQSKTLSSLRSIQIIECVSIIKALCPQIFENLKVLSFKEIDALDFTELITVYQKEISPWYANWFKEFNKILTESIKIKENSQDK